MSKQYGPYYRRGEPGGPGCPVGVLPISAKGPDEQQFDGQLLDAGNGERIMAVLLRSHPRSAGIPTGILNLARAYLHLGKSDRGRECLQVICRKYPESSECHIARKLLQGQTQG